MTCLLTSPAAGQEPVPPAVGESARPALRIGLAAGNLRLDGVLDEDAWTRADSIANLVQIEPVEGQAPSGRTVVRVLSTGDALVFGIRADDPDAGQITSFSRSRDANLTNRITSGSSTRISTAVPATCSSSTPTGRGLTPWSPTRAKARTHSGTRSGRPRHTAPPGDGPSRSGFRSRACSSSAGSPSGASTCSDAFSDCLNPHAGRARTATSRSTSPAGPAS